MDGVIIERFHRDAGQGGPRRAKAGEGVQILGGRGGKGDRLMFLANRRTASAYR
jgi:hypothetical protein